MTSLFALARIRLMNAYASIRDREEGQGMTEYAVLIAGIVVMVAAVVAVLSLALSGKIGDIIDSI